MSRKTQQFARADELLISLTASVVFDATSIESLLPFIAFFYDVNIILEVFKKNIILLLLLFLLLFLLFSKRFLLLFISFRFFTLSFIFLRLSISMLSHCIGWCFATTYMLCIVLMYCSCPSR